MKPMIGAVVLGALAVGGGVVLATSRHPADAQSYQVLTPSAATGVPASVDPTGPVMMPAVISDTTAWRPQALLIATSATNPAPRRVVYRHRVAYRAAPAHTRVVRHTRSTKHSVAIIGGSTVGGALVGGLVGGGKGAVVGGLVGGAAGTAYDRKTRHRVRRE